MVWQQMFQFWTIIAILIRKKLQKTESLKILLKYGWEEIAISGVR